MMRPDPARVTTALFVPGDRPERFAKAIASGAGMVILDLEDAVASGSKAQARDNVFAALSADDGISAAVRVNSSDDDVEGDIEMLASLEDANRLLAVMLPKTQPPDLARFEKLLPRAVFIPLIESALGLAEAMAIASSARVIRLAFGALDFALDVDSSSPTVLDFARCALVVASRAADIAPPMDSPSPQFVDVDAVRASAKSARALGLGGQLCIHPSQVSLVEESFRPSADEIEWAQRIVALGSGGATRMEGGMVDRPIVLRAEAILQRR